MKKKQVKNTQKTCKAVYTRSQKIKGWLAFIMLFVCGVMVGVSVGQNNANSKQSLAQTINEIQSEQKDACVVVEEIQLGWLFGENSANIEDHKSNIRVYETLFQHGCEENKVKYRTAIAREMEILDALAGAREMEILDALGGEQKNLSTCEKIEASLLDMLPHDGVNTRLDERIVRAKIYANLSERGCPENTTKYVEMSKQELEIARALADDVFQNHETIEVVETYKRLNMQAAAEEIFETVKKLTNPAIDFILEVEKIINEK